ncbi:1,2-phenylacetyl-CoA epoxidase subunit PaaD [Marinospirillum alkaliphilum]|uniref:Ring-1,2-phenylacetyl-CoA epoxidase subunit PaaD n=1 Tax=Marinospirillum alkaliphilum DSM 21637 TaxID=1122209 RepID=A0A1K1TB22_9GAMM|nr:1,2-phenylacetyl-CoA epoxidase subunit PaaD [Marinospirillum alkaliphilum]SFW97714.1 ring-1,2-phenylacetyl-CoA epoxidase subunit PaaD [Marinospirillum alkaliphilum DSM 21637]
MQKSGNQPRPIPAPLEQPIIASDRVPANVGGEQLTETQLWQLLDEVKDPEVPVVSVVELGIVRSIQWLDNQLQVAVTPTYSGCPATELIEQQIAAALMQAGIRDPQVTRVLNPAWTTDWISDSGREKLRAYGIAPPQGSASKMTLLGHAEQISCPHCGSSHTEQVSEFGSTACKALYRCIDCLEPFDYFKCI